MTGLGLSPTDILAAVAVVLVLLFVWRSGARRARARARAASASARLVSLSGRVVFNAALIVLAQWAVITYQGDAWVKLTVLGLPALFASYTLTRAVTVTTIDLSRHPREGRRR